MIRLNPTLAYLETLQLGDGNNQHNVYHTIAIYSWLAVQQPSTCAFDG